jgi:hypothetical protein
LRVFSHVFVVSSGEDGIEPTEHLLKKYFAAARLAVARQRFRLL